jgi:prepilin-type processing-associated H-X9-DG protein
VRVLAGGANAAWVDGSPTAARFSAPSGIMFDTLGVLYVTDFTSHLIRVISSMVVTTLAGSNYSSGLVDGSGTAAKFNSPQGLAVDSNRVLYVADTGNTAIRKITTAGSVSTIFQGRTFVAVALSPSNVLYASEKPPFVISQIATSGIASRTVFAGSGTSAYADGQGTSASFVAPTGIAFNASGGLFVCEFSSQTIRMITPTGYASISY